ncbi:hypothetical protein H6F32_14090 [Anabaena sp. FACHB-1237]|uniref:hypothetical protein n=1 Tax=Anabaena sp. FACHB-1237 TaxID=2692769 RepID=UPI00168021D9|nr:hypothetical protein [Anabaena sp. FACHB-1237]MBD2138690.1 hypothetical protein [Anabaena sp. FACHB-1237]
METILIEHISQYILNTTFVFFYKTLSKTPIYRQFMPRKPPTSLVSGFPQFIIFNCKIVLPHRVYYSKFKINCQDPNPNLRRKNQKNYNS